MRTELSFLHHYGKLTVHRTGCPECNEGVREILLTSDESAVTMRGKLAEIMWDVLYELHRDVRSSIGRNKAPETLVPSE